MRLSRIEISGFRGIREKIDLRFPSGFTVISGRNGTGKSTFCDAIEYVLTGDIRRESDYSENREGYGDYIKWCGAGEPEEGTYVKLHIRSEDSEEIVVTRGPDIGFNVRPNINGDGAPETTSDRPEETLISELCLPNQAPDRPLRRLCETSIIRDERITDLSVEAGERNRYKFVQRALGTNVFADSVDHAEKVRDKLRGRSSELERQLEKHDSEVNRLQSEIESAREKVENIESAERSLSFVRSKLTESGRLEEDENIETTDLVSRARRLTVDLREDANELARVLSEYSDLRDRIETYREGGETARRKQEQASKIEAIQEQIEDIESEKEDLEAQLDDFQEQRPDKTNLAELHRLGQKVGLTEEGECPLCGESHTTKEFETRLRQLRDRVNEIIEQVDVLKDRIDQRAEKLSDLRDQEKKLRREQNDLRDQRSALVSRLEDLRERVDDILSNTGAEIEELASGVAEITSDKEVVIEEIEGGGQEANEIPAFDQDGLEREINKRRRLRTQLDEKVSDVEASLALDKIENLQTKLDQEQQKREEVQTDLRHARKKAEQADKVRKRIEEEEGQVHKDRIRKLAPLLAELYSRLRPHVDWKNLEPKVRGEIQLYLRFDVGGHNPSLFFSSGQRRAVGLAFLIAVHLGCTWSRLNTLILDDPVQHIDDFRALQLTEVLSAIRRSGRQMVVTVEDEALARLLRRRLRSSEAQEGQHVRMAYDSRSGAKIKDRTPIGPMPRQLLQAEL